MFTQSKIHWLSRTVRELYTARTISDFTRVSMAAIDAQFHLLASACEEMGRRARSYVAHGLRCSVKPPDDYAVHHHDNPFAPTLAAGRPCQILHLRRQFSSVVWARTDHFNGIARPMGWNDQLMMVAQNSPTLVAVGMYRDRVFTDREHVLARLLQPHLVAAWCRVRETEDRGGPTKLMPLTLSPALRPLWLSLPQRQVLHAYFPHWRKTNDLPELLHAWVAQSLASLREEPPPHPLRAFTVDSTRGRLLVRCFPDRPGGIVILILVETTAKPDDHPPWAGRLTARESEILHWIAGGKRDGEIAVILGVSPRTVGKHVEHILTKLNAPNRTSAAGIVTQ